MNILKGRKIFGGKASGESMVSKEAISFFGGIDPDTGTIVEKGHPLEKHPAHVLFHRAPVIVSREWARSTTFWQSR